jgi:WD40 repeat protein
MQRILHVLLFFLLTPVYAQTDDPAFPQLEPLTVENLDKLQELATLEVDEVMSLAISPDSRVLAVNTFDSIQLFDLNTLKMLHQIETDNVRTVAFSPDSTRLVSGALFRSLQLWDAETGTLLHTFEGHENGVNTVAFSRDGQYIASGDGDCVGQAGSSECTDTDNNTVRLWDADTRELLSVINFPVIVDEVIFTLDSQTLFVGTDSTAVNGWDVEALIDLPETTWETATINLYDIPQSFAGSSGGIHSLAFNPQGTILAATGLGGNGVSFIWMWDIPTGETILPYADYDSYFMTATFNVDGSILAFNELYDTIHLWDSERAEELTTLSLPDSTIRSNSLAFSPDGRLLAIGTDEGSVHFYGVPAD